MCSKQRFKTQLRAYIFAEGENDVEDSVIAEMAHLVFKFLRETGRVADEELFLYAELSAPARLLLDAGVLSEKELVELVREGHVDQAAFVGDYLSIKQRAARAVLFDDVVAWADKR